MSKWTEGDNYYPPESYLDELPITCTSCSKECKSIDLALNIHIYEAGELTQILMKKQGNSYILPIRMLCELQESACLEQIRNPYKGRDEIGLLKTIPIFLGLSRNDDAEQGEIWLFFKDVANGIPNNVLRILLQRYDNIQELIPPRKMKAVKGKAM